MSAKVGTIAEAVKRAIKDMSGLGKSTRRQYKSLIKNFLLYLYEHDLDPLSWGSDDVSDWMSSVRVGEGRWEVKDLFTSDFRRKRAALRYLVVYAGDGNPLVGLRRPMRRERHAEAFPTEMLTALLKMPAELREANPKIDPATCRRDEAVLALFVYAGLRVSEVSALRLQDVYRTDEGGTALIAMDCWNTRNSLRVIGKGDKERLVPVPAKLRKRLMEYIKSPWRVEQLGPWMFPSASESGHISVPRVRELAKRYGSATGSPVHTPHSFRRAYATWWAKKRMRMYVAKGKSARLGLDHAKAELQDFLGHESRATTEVYIYERLKGVVPDDIDEIFEEVGE